MKADEGEGGKGAPRGVGNECTSCICIIRFFMLCKLISIIEDEKLFIMYDMNMYHSWKIVQYCGTVFVVRFTVFINSST